MGKQFLPDNLVTIIAEGILQLGCFIRYRLLMALDIGYHFFFLFSCPF
jgi:hypothetical protein